MEVHFWTCRVLLRKLGFEKEQREADKIGSVFLFLVIFTNVVKQTSLVINLSLGGIFQSGTAEAFTDYVV